MKLTAEEVSHSLSVISGTYARDAISETLVVDGYGASLRVERGRLQIADGIGVHRRTRTLSRIDRTVRRLVVLAHSGNVTLDALQWCRDVGITVVVTDTMGTLHLVSPVREKQDARIVRSQALALVNGYGMRIATDLLDAKIRGQASVLRDCVPGSESVAEFLDGYATNVRDADSLSELLSIEAAAASDYFTAWRTRVRPHFARTAMRRVPDHWQEFPGRKSPLTGARGNSKATDPVNALLNYAYALGLSECVIACHAVGLLPDLGVLHTDKRDRDSMALDLLEPLRPVIDRMVLGLLDVRHFAASDFVETPDGTCRLTVATTHTVAEWLPRMAAGVAEHAENVAHVLADSADGYVRMSRPLTGSNRRRAQEERKEKRDAQRPADSVGVPARRTVRTVAAPMPSCEMCGKTLADRKRKVCPECWPQRRAELAAASLTTERAHNADWRERSNSPEARAKKSETISQNRREKHEWEAANPGVALDVDAYRRDILPGLTALTTGTVARALGVSTSSASRIRAGRLLPHVRHVPTLSRLVREAQ